jgi:hypothetical protein
MSLKHNNMCMKNHVIYIDNDDLVIWIMGAFG